MLVQTARAVYWKKWAAKHEYEELKEGAWLEPGPALLRKKVRENWTEKYRNVGRKIFLEGGWTQKILFDIDWSDTSQCQACKKRKGHKSTGYTTARSDTKSDVRFQKFSRSWCKKQEPQRRSGSGKEVLLRIFSVKANGTVVISA